MNDDDRLFERARAAGDLEAIGGTKLYGSGPKRRGECPLCGQGKGKRSSFAYEVDFRKKRFTCYVCGRSGSAVDLEHLMRSEVGQGLADAARRILKEGRPPPAARPSAPVAAPVAFRDEAGFTAEMARRLWSEAVPAAGTLVQRYLLARGIHGRPLTEALKHLRFHPDAHHSGRGQHSVSFPGMIGLVRTPAGPTGGVHVTYLRRDGSGKAKAPEGRDKIMWGPQSRDGVSGAVWLSHPQGDGPLVVGEGIVTTLAFACLQDRPVRAAAPLSLNRLSGMMKADAWGRVDPDVPQLDPLRPGWTWPDPPGAPFGEVLIAVDHDMKPVRVKVRGVTGRTEDRMIGATERMRLSAALAKQSWRLAGQSHVSTHAPPVGLDFTDMLEEALNHG